jgi:hypothetical protein
LRQRPDEKKCSEDAALSSVGSGEVRERYPAFVTFGLTRQS